MTQFESVHQDSIVGKVETFDRIIFKGHLSRFFPDGAFKRFLDANGVLLKEFKPFVQQVTAELKVHVQKVAADADRPYEYLGVTYSKSATGMGKDDKAKAIARKDNITEGLIAVFAALEPCWSFTVRGNRDNHRLEVIRKKTKCLHYYFYFIDPEFGFMHVRLQSWFPFQIQIYVNGREWLSRRLDSKGIAYDRYGNSLFDIEDPDYAKQLCDSFTYLNWPTLLEPFALRVNPYLSIINELGFGSYYWVIDQAEYATDIEFSSREALDQLLPDLLAHSILALSAEDVLRFLGRKLHGNLKAEVTTDHKRRPEGCRVKHAMNRNSVKMYDKYIVLRIETTINSPSEFKTLVHRQTPKGPKPTWIPMRKGVADFWRYAEVGRAVNTRYLDALAEAKPTTEAVQHLDEVCRPTTRNGRSVPRLNPITQQDSRLFKAVLNGAHAINGFRNGDIARLLFPDKLQIPEERKRICAKVSRLIAKLRGHRLIAKVKNARLYRVTKLGLRIMCAALRCRYIVFPTAYADAMA